MSKPKAECFPGFIDANWLRKHTNLYEVMDFKANFGDRRLRLSFEFLLAAQMREVLVPTILGCVSDELSARFYERFRRVLRAYYRLAQNVPEVYCNSLRVRQNMALPRVAWRMIRRRRSIAAVVSGRLGIVVVCKCDVGLSMTAHQAQDHCVALPPVVSAPAAE